jgi:hypothetical protein
MFKFSCLLLATALLSASALYANEEMTIEQKLASLKLERMQAEAMIKTMAHSGRLNEKEVAHATRSIASAKEEDVEIIRAEAMESLKSSKSLATK